MLFFFFYKTILNELEITETLMKESHVLLKFRHNQNIPLGDIAFAQGFDEKFQNRCLKREAVQRIRILPGLNIYFSNSSRWKCTFYSFIPLFQFLCHINGDHGVSLAFTYLSSVSNESCIFGLENRPDSIILHHII